MGQRLEGRTALVTGSTSTIGRTDLVRADLDGTSSAGHELAAEAVRRLGEHIDIVVNNAVSYTCLTIGGATNACCGDRTAWRIGNAAAEGVAGPGAGSW